MAARRIGVGAASQRPLVEYERAEPAHVPCDDGARPRVPRHLVPRFDQRRK